MASQQAQNTALLERGPHSLRRIQSHLSIGDLERFLLTRWPAHTAETWDKTGLLVGDRSKPIQGVAIALDPTVACIKAAAAAGANVLLTHHPVHLGGVEDFAPAHSDIEHAGACIYAAIEDDIALMNFHTALDVAQDAQMVLPKLLQLDFVQVFEPLHQHPHLGYGQLCTPSCKEDLRLIDLAQRCSKVFGRKSRVWGDLETRVQRIVTTTGSAASMPKNCVENGIDCLVCGEVKYHMALSAKEAGLCLIDLGHDVSELPLTSCLLEACLEAGVAPDEIILCDQSDNWTTVG